MIGNNDWLDYMYYRDHIAHSMGMWDKSKVKYKDKIPVGGGKFRYIYDEPRNPRSRGRMEPRTVQQQRAMGRSGGMTRTPTSSRQASRSVNFRDRASGVRTQASPSFNFRGQADETRARREAERRDMNQQAMQRRAQTEQQVAENKRPKNLFDHMGNALNAAGRMAGDAARGVGNWVGDRAREVGEAASGAWNNVTGGDGRLDLDDIRRGADSAIKGASRAIGLEARSDLDAARNKEADTREWRDKTREETQKAYERGAGSGNSWQDSYTQAAQAHGAASRDLREAQNAYDNTLAGRVENAANAAGNWLGDAARNVGDWFGDRAKDVGDWVGDRASEARDAVDQLGARAGSAYDRMTGREEGTTWNNVTGGDNHFNYGDVQNVANAVGRRAQNLYDQAGNAIGGVGDFIGDRVGDARDAVSGVVDNAGRRLGSAYDRISGREDGTTWNRVTGGDDHLNYEDVGNAMNAAGREAQNIGRGVAQRVGSLAGDIRDVASDTVDRAGRRLGSAYDQMTGRENGSTWNTVTGGDNHFNYGDVSNLASAAGREAQNVGRAVGQMTGNAVASARNLIKTAGGNIAQALSLAQQRLRYAQNTGNPQMERDAQEVIRTLESPSFNFKDRATMNTRLYENQIPETTLEEERLYEDRIPETILEEERLRNRR